MGRTIGRMSSSRKQPRSESFARKKVSKSPNNASKIRVGDCVEVSYAISGKGYEGKCWAKIVRVKGKRAKVQWFYVHEELKSVIEEDCPSMKKTFSTLEPMQKEIYFSKDIITIDTHKIADKVPPIQCLCRQCAVDRFSKKKIKALQTYDFWYSFVFDRGCGTIVSETCNLCGNLSAPPSSKGDFRTSQSSTAVTKTPTISKNTSKSSSEQKLRTCSNFRSLERKVSLVDTTPKRIFPKRTDSRVLTAAEVEEIVSSSCEKTPTKPAYTEKVKSSKKPLQRKLQLDSDSDFDGDTSEDLCNGDSDAYEFLKSDSESCLSSDNEEVLEDLPMLSSRKRSPTKSSQKLSREAKVPRSTRTTAKKAAERICSLSSNAKSTTKKAVSVCSPQTAKGRRLSRDISISLPKRSILKSKKPRSPQKARATIVEAMVAESCRKTSAKVTHAQSKKAPFKKSVRRKLQLDVDSDFDGNVSETQCSSDDDDDVYEFLKSDTESSLSSDDDEDFISTSRKRARTKSLEKPKRDAKVLKSARSTTDKATKKMGSRSSKAKSTTKKTVSVHSPPTTKRRRLSKDASISLPKRSVPKSKQPRSPYQMAQEKLHLSAVPETLPCRGEEFMQIFNFVEKKLKTRSGGCLYISGVPGTGKTATVHEVMRSLEESRNEGVVRDFKFVDINGMRLTTPQQAFSAIWKQLKGEHVSPDHAATLLDKYFQSGRSSQSAIVLLADELDLLWTKKQRILYSLFDWPTRPKAGLIVLAIANTMDLPERIMMNRVSSRLGLTRLTFQPYTFKQLEEIVKSRLEGLKVFEPDALQLAARKVAAVSGDARRALNICRRATEVAEQRIIEIRKGAKKSEKLVGIKDVDAAVTEMFSSPYIVAIRSASVLEQVFLKSIVAEFRRLGIEEATFENVYKQLVAQCRIEGLRTPNTSTVSDVCCRLYLSRLILVESGRLGLQQKIRLNISVDDVVFALQKKRNP
jgi:origin recognition complex subunit 1